MATYILRRKCFDIVADGNSIKGMPISQVKDAYDKAGGSAKFGNLANYRKQMGDLNAGANVTTKGLAQNAVNTGKLTTAKSDLAIKTAQKTGNTSNIANAGYKSGFSQGSAAGFAQGQKSVGFMQGAKNTWNNMGTAGKIGTAAAAAGGAYLLGKGLFGNKKKEGN